MSDLGQLIADLESAQVGSLHYDKRILAALGFTWRGMAYWNSQEQWKGSAALTRSMDAIVALIERKLPGWHIQVERHPDFCDATLWPSPDAPYWLTHAATMPLALCASFLRALQAQQEGSEDA